MRLTVIDMTVVLVAPAAAVGLGIVLGQPVGALGWRRDLDPAQQPLWGRAPFILGIKGGELRHLNGSCFSKAA